MLWEFSSDGKIISTRFDTVPFRPQVFHPNGVTLSKITIDTLKVMCLVGTYFGIVRVTKKYKGWCNG